MYADDQPSEVRGTEALSGTDAGGRVAFRYPNFRYYMTARMLATVASEMQAVAVGWQIYNLTHRALDLGLVGLAQFLPGILLFLVAGQAADRFPRQRILQCCYVAFSADIGAASGIDAARADVGVAGVCGARPERRGAKFQWSGGAGVPAAGGAGRSISQRGGTWVRACFKGRWLWVRWWADWSMA